MAAYSHYTRILVEKHEGVAVATFNRPEVLNAFDEQMHTELENLFVDAGKDEDVRALILTGAGRAFSAGTDIKAMKGGSTGGISHTIRRLKAAHTLVNNVLDLPKPFIVAVNGVSAGVATTVALLADIIIMSEKAKIADTHVKVGIAAGDGGALIWPLLVGIHRAKEFLLTGDWVDAKQAEHIGLANRVVSEDELMPIAMDFAKRLAKGAPLAIQFTKMSINKLIKQNMNLLLDSSLGWEGLSMFTDDHKEATDAFKGKRDPSFQGR